MKKLEKILKQASKRALQPMVTARFGDNWKKSAYRAFTYEEAIDTAWQQGRYAIQLERVIEEMLKAPEKTIDLKDLEVILFSKLGLPKECFGKK